MSEPEPNVYPDTLEKIFHARSLPDLPWGEPFTPYRNIGQLLDERAFATPDKTFLTYYDETGRAASYTYAEFYRLVRQVARFMQTTFDVQARDRVATLRSNDPCTVVIYFAAWLLGATVVPINLNEENERIAFILQNSNTKVLCTTQDQFERLNRLSHKPPYALVLTPQPGETEIDALHSIRTEPLPTENRANVPPDAEALIVYTSGTTGNPKGVVLDHANLLADAKTITDWHHFTPDDGAMNVLPLHHVNGITVTLMTPLYSGGSVVVNRKFHAQKFWKTLADEKCTWCSVVPTILAFLTERKDDLSQFDLSRFRHIICGAGPLTIETAKRFDEAFGVRVVHGYGLSETTCYSSFLPIDLDRDSYRHWMFDCGFPSIGCPVSANAMAIHDANGEALPPDARGEIVARGHNVMRYYFGRPDVNRDTFAHGWFRSGDEGFYRKGEDGRDYYFITGRIKELIIRGGINYSPFDIDEVLNAIPGVRAAMAVGFENNFYGEEIGAYVQREPGVMLTDDYILHACRQRLPFAKSPKVVVFGADFPVTSTGKYQRNKLKPLFAEWKDTQFRQTRE